MCYIFIILFPFMILIPSYPVAVGFIYVLTIYPVLFLGANKGQQSNDLLYSTLLPIRKKDIVFARIMTVVICQFAFILIMTALWPISKSIQDSVVITEEGSSNYGQLLSSMVPGIGLDGFISLLAIALVGFAIADLIFFPIYYKHGKSIVMSTLLTILGFAAYLMIFTVALPYFPVIGESYKAFMEGNIGIQFALLGGALLIYVPLHYLIYRISASRLEKVDF